MNEGNLRPSVALFLAAIFTKVKNHERTSR
jgi:hypothetical protein